MALDDAQVIVQRQQSQMLQGDGPVTRPAAPVPHVSERRARGVECGLVGGAGGDDHDACAVRFLWPALAAQRMVAIQDRVEQGHAA